MKCSKSSAVVGFSRFTPVLQNRLTEFYEISEPAGIPMVTDLLLHNWINKPANKKFKSRPW